MSSPVDRAEFERWVAQAHSAREAAALSSGGGRHDWACFLSEQSAQLCVKGLLHGVGAEAWGHDLVALCERAASQIGPQWPGSIVACAARLSRHYIPTRYPDAHASGSPSTHYTASDSAQAAADAAEIERAVLHCWSELAGEP